MTKQYLEGVAFVYPGQGAQFMGMGLDILAAYPKFYDLWKKAEQILPYDISRIIESDEESLKLTVYTQPALFLVEVLTTKILNDVGFYPHVSAGLSLGEYSALYQAGAFSFEDGLKLVQRRGELMASASGSMLAILGADLEDIIDTCALVRRDLAGTVALANDNSPIQKVVAGEDGCVKEVAKRIKRNRIKAIPLKVSGAFHTEMMMQAAEDFKHDLQKQNFHNLRNTVYSNYLGDIHTDVTLRANLEKQMTHPVQWHAIIQKMCSTGIHTYVEVGPGKSLGGMIKQIQPKARCLQTGNKEYLEETISYLKYLI